MATKDLATVPEQSNYVTLLSDPDMALAIRENIGGQITPFMLPRVRIPTGGTNSWTLVDVNGEMYPSKALTGVIVHYATWRGYWREPFGIGNQFPDCSSRDGVIGIGDPGIECAGCPFNEFGTTNRDNGRGKACKEMRAVFLLQEGDVFPTMLLLPPTSIKDATGYMMFLANKRKAYWKVVTTLTLTPDKNAEGIAFAKASPKLERDLTEQEMALIQQYRINIRPMLEAEPITQADVQQSEPA